MPARQGWNKRCDVQSGVSIRWGPRGRADVAELAARSGSVSDACWRVPIPVQKLVDALGRMIWQSGEHVSEPGLRSEIVELGGGDGGVDGSRPTATVVRGGECACVWPERHGPE